MSQVGQVCRSQCGVAVSPASAAHPAKPVRTEAPAPYYAARIPVILRKRKAYELEREYLEAWAPHIRCFHLESPRVITLLDRMRKLAII